MFVAAASSPDAPKFGFALSFSLPLSSGAAEREWDRERERGRDECGREGRGEADRRCAEGLPRPFRSLEPSRPRLSDGRSSLFRE